MAYTSSIKKYTSRMAQRTIQEEERGYDADESSEVTLANSTHNIEASSLRKKLLRKKRESLLDRRRTFECLVVFVEERCARYKCDVKTYADSGNSAHSVKDHCLDVTWIEERKTKLSKKLTLFCPMNFLTVPIYHQMMNPHY